MISASRFGTKRKFNVRQTMLCPVCGERKPLKKFQKSKRDLRRLLTCRDCRSKNSNAERLFFGQIKNPKQVFRERFEAVGNLLKKTKKEVKNLTDIKRQAVSLVKFPERVAAIVGKTYPVCGDDFKLSDDEALCRIRDLLDELDDTIIARNKNKRLSKTS